MWTSVERLGYLGLTDSGYVLARRALRFGEDVSPWLSADAASAFRRGSARAWAEWSVPPLAGAAPKDRRRYEKDRDRVQRRLDRGAARPFDLAPPRSYTFSGRAPLRVSFLWPGCGVTVRLPSRVRVPIQLRCGVCDSRLDCET